MFTPEDDKKIKNMKWVSDKKNPKFQVLKKPCYSLLLVEFEDGTFAKLSFRHLIEMSNKTAYYFNFYERENTASFSYLSGVSWKYLTSYFRSSCTYYETYCKRYGWLRGDYKYNG